MTATELRELDAAVAVEVFGYVYVNGRDRCEGESVITLGDKYSLVYPPDKAQEWCQKFPDCVIAETPWAEPMLLTPEYPWSSTMNGAWEVVGELWQSGRFLDIGTRLYVAHDGTLCVMAEFKEKGWGLDTGFYCHIESAGENPDKATAISICLAAIKAVRAGKEGAK